jgi:hypothetical protein
MVRGVESPGEYGCVGLSKATAGGSWGPAERSVSDRFRVDGTLAAREIFSGRAAAEGRQRPDFPS